MESVENLHKLYLIYLNEILKHFTKKILAMYFSQYIIDNLYFICAASLQANIGL